MKLCFVTWVCSRQDAVAEERACAGCSAAAGPAGRAWRCPGPGFGRLAWRGRSAAERSCARTRLPKAKQPHVQAANAEAFAAGFALVLEPRVRLSKDVTRSNDSGSRRGKFDCAKRWST